MPPGSFYIRRPTFMRPVHAVIHTVEYALRCKLCNNKVTFHTHTSIKANAYFYFLLKCVLLCLSFSHKPTIPHTHTHLQIHHTRPPPHSHWQTSLFSSKPGLHTHLPMGTSQPPSALQYILGASNSSEALTHTPWTSTSAVSPPVIVSGNWAKLSTVRGHFL